MKKPTLLLFTAVLIGFAAWHYQTSVKPRVAKAPETDSMTNGQMLDQNAPYVAEGQEVSYFGKAKGYYASPKEPGTYPGVVMIHEWWGLNQHIKDMAKTLAGQGYKVLAVDLYNGIVAQTPDEARAQVTSIKQEEANKNMQAAVAFLKLKSAGKIASFGWCFGGAQSMQLALSGQALDATVIYYGTLVTDTQKLAAIKWPVLGVFGDQDQSIKPETAQAFDKALDELKIENEVYIYPGVGHAFANPSGSNFAPNETKDAWEKTLTFLQKALKS